MNTDSYSFKRASFAAALFMFAGAVSANPTGVTSHPSGEWTVTKLTGDASQCVVTDGTLVYGYAKDNRTVNGVSFQTNSKLSAATGNIEVVPAYGYDKDDFSNNDQTAADLENGDWKSLLGRGWLCTSGTPAASTFTFKNLTPGNVYTAQLIVHNGNNTDTPARSIITPDGQEGFYGRGKDGSRLDWSLGSSLVGTFVATGTVHQLTFSYSQKAVAWKCLNAVQLRDLGAYSPVSINARSAGMIPGDWLVSPLAGETGDLVTRGDIVMNGSVAQAFGGADVTVAGIPFTNLNFGFGGNCIQVDLWSNWQAGDGILGDCGLAGDYGTLLANGWAGNNQSTDRRIQLSGLEVGGLYILQGIVHDARNPLNQLTIAGRTLKYGAATDSEPWYYGGTFVHEFQATDVSYTIDLDYPLYGSLINGIQLRRLPDVTQPSIGAAGATVSGTTATISMASVVVGMGWDATAAETYDVWAKLGSHAAEKVIEGASSSAASFDFTDLDPGEYTCTLSIVNDKGLSSAECNVTFTIGSFEARTFVVTDASDDLNNPAEGTLRAILSQVRTGDTVTFDLEQMGTDTIKIVGVNENGTDTTLVIEKGVTIDGNGVVLDGGWDGILKSSTGGRIFLVPADIGRVTISNMTFKNGHGRGWNVANNRYFQGGALCALSPVRVENCRFIGNCAADESAWAPSLRGGAAIYAEADIEVFDCTFENNVGGNANNSYGGTILLNKTSARIERITVDHDRAGSYGGGFLYGEDIPSLIIRDATFEGLRSASRGGALYLRSFTSVLIERSSFVGCDAGYSWGGAVMLGDGTCGKAVFRDCEFTDCSGQCGGAIRSHARPGIFVNCTFTGCAMNGDAWGPALDSRGEDYCINCTFAGNMFTDNNHGGSGGFAACRYGSSCRFLNTVGAFNYNRAAADASGALETGRDFYDNNFINTICNGKEADRATDLASDSPLFAEYEERTGITCWGNEINLKDGVVVPVFVPDPKHEYPTRTFGIVKDGLLEGTGYPVMVNADYSHVCYSTDGGSSWTDLYKNGTPDDTTLALIAADQRGVPYYHGKTPIGAGTFYKKAEPGCAIFVR